MGVHAAGSDRGGDPGREAQEDADTPEVGVTCSLHRSPVGWATSRRASGEWRSNQITNAATGRATAAAAALTPDTVTERC